uniref:Xylulose kinase-1 n=1 Tax=Tanacetum cinerariifolium TaxID=118510 RepID=A0A6L2J3W6_TANCI|nr:xylulose kinase-1 [Tanacetum cinerariifolium]
MTALLYKDDHNKVSYLEKRKGCEAYEQILDFLNRSHIRYALTHHPPIIFDSLVKQFWATATVRTLEAGPLKIIATIDSNEVVVTESLIKTQLQLNDKTGLTYNFSRFILDGMIRNIGSKRHIFLMYPRFLQMILGIQTIDPSPRPTFDFTAKLFSNMKLNWDGPHMPLLAPMLVVPAGGDGADAAAAGAAAANEVPPPPLPPVTPPPDVPPTHTSYSTPGPSTVAQDTPVRDPTPMREPTPVREPHLVLSEEVGPTTSTIGNDSISIKDPLHPLEPWLTYQTTSFNTTTSTRPPSPTRQTSFLDDISEGGGGYVSLPKSNEALETDTQETDKNQAKNNKTKHKVEKIEKDKVNQSRKLKVKAREADQAPPTTAAGGAEDSVALTDLSLKLDRCINRVTTLENELGVTKKVLGCAVLKLVSRVKRLEGILNQRKRRMVLSNSKGDTTFEAGYTIYKASQDAHASSDAGHDKNEVPDTTTMPFRRTRTKRRLRKTFTSLAFEHFQENISTVEDTIPAGDGIPAAAQTIPAGSTPIPTTEAVDKGKASMVDDSIPADLLTEQEHVLKNLYDYQLAEDLAKKLQAEQETEFASVLAALSIAVDVSVYAISTTTANVSVSELPIQTSGSIGVSIGVTEATTTSIHDPLPPTTPAEIPHTTSPRESIGAYTHGVESQKESTTVVFTFGVSHATPSSSRRRRKKIAKKKVTPIVDVADVNLIKFNSTSESDGDPSPYAPYVSWEMVPTSLGSIHVYYDMEEHTKHFTSRRELLHMVEKNDLRDLLGDVDKFYQRQEPETFGLILWGDLCVHVLETVDGQVIYMFVDVSYPLSEATLKRMLSHGLEVPKLLVGGDLTMAKHLVRFIKAAMLNA